MVCNRIVAFILTYLAFEIVSMEICSHIPVDNYSLILQNIDATFQDSRILVAHNVVDNITSFLQECTKPIFLVNLNKSMNAEQITERYDVFVVIIKYIQDFKNFLKMFQKSEQFNTRGKFLVLFLGEDPIEDIFEISWQNYIINIDVFVWNGSEVYIYTYFPYNRKNCGKNLTAELLGKYPLHALFPNKVPSNFHGCSIKILVDIFEPCTLAANFTTDDATRVGFETVLLKNVLERMNLTPIAIQTPGTLLGAMLPNGEFDGLLKYLRNRDCELMVGHMWPKPPYYFEYFDISDTYYQDYIYWYVPSATLGEKWESLYLIFSPAMWLSVFVMCVLNILVWITFTRLVEDMQVIRSVGWCVLETWRGLLQGSFKLPRTAVMRTLVICWSAIGFILAAAYQSQLLSLLTTPIYNHQISTLQELADSSVRIPYAGYALDTYRNSGVEVEERILKKAQIYSLDEFIKRVRERDGNTAYVASAVRVRYNNFVFRNLNRSLPNLYEIQKPALTNYICMYTGRGYPLLEQINKHIALFLENGLFYKWLKDTNGVGHVKSETQLEKLSINHFKGIFGLWLFGLLLSIFVFGTEVLIARNRKHKRVFM